MNVPTPDNPRTRSPIAKALAVSAAGMAVGFGTCGIAAVSGGSRSSEFFIPSGALVFALSLLAFIATLVVALVKWLGKSIRQ